MPSRRGLPRWRTVHDDADFAREAMEAGALGYVIKQRIASDLIAAVKEAHAGRQFLGLGGKKNSGGVAP